MSKTRKATVNVKGTDIAVLVYREQDYISLTDIARPKNAGLTDDLIRNGLRNRNTIEFLGIWESLNNPGFNPVEFDGFGAPPGRRQKQREASSKFKEAPSAFSPSRAETIFRSPIWCGASMGEAR